MVFNGYKYAKDDNGKFIHSSYIGSIVEATVGKKAGQRFFVYGATTYKKPVEWLEANFDRLHALKHLSIMSPYEYQVVETFDKHWPLGVSIFIEYQHGLTLEEVTYRAKFIPLKYILRFGIEICDALQTLHDLDPPFFAECVRSQDIFIDSSGHAKLFNLGYGIQFESDLRGTMGSIFRPELAIGNYFAPEYYAYPRVQEITSRQDIYCLGSTLHQIVTFEDHMMSTKVKHPSREERHDTLAATLLETDAPQPLQDIILKATAPKPEDRYQTAEAMKNDLVAFRDSLSDDDLEMLLPKDRS